jgi:hypothetical protein
MEIKRRLEGGALQGDTMEYTRETRDGIEVLVYPDGTVKRADNGHFLSPPRDAKITTSERGKELLQRRKDKAIVSQLKGLARLTGTELPADADLEQTIEGASDALEAITRHFGATFLQSSNLRGMAESYKQLAAPLVGTEPEKGNTYNTVNVVEMSEEVLQAIADLRARLMPGKASVNAMDILEGRWEPKEE